MSDLPEFRPFPVDAESLDLLVAGIRNDGGDGSNLSGVLDFLANESLMPNLDADDEPMWEQRWSYSPSDAILALVDEVRGLRKITA